MIQPLAALHPFRCNAASGEPRPIDLLPSAPTLRTASILLDQHHGAFDRAVRDILHSLATNPAEAVEPLRRLAAFAPIGRHLVEPWKVVVAGPPNVGKSSLVNALAGYQRSVVSEVAGTTRDAVGVRLAFDGWPVELIDTAGLRESEGLEAEGVALAKRELAAADLVVWVLDATAPAPTWPVPDEDWPLPHNGWFVLNKADEGHAGEDRFPPWVRSEADDVPLVSARTGFGIAGLIETVVLKTVGAYPLEYQADGSAVPFTPHLADTVEAAHAALAAGEIDEAKRLLRACLEPGR